MTDEHSIDEADDTGVLLGPEVQYVVPATAIETIVADEALDRAAGLIPAAEPARPEGDAARRVETLGAALHAKLDALQALFEREVRAEATREKVVDRLHAELQEYKQDLLLGLLRPIFIDLIQLHDDIGKIVEAAPAGDPSVLRGLQQGIEDILYRQGVEPFSRDGGTFDPRRQRAVATVATDDPARNKTIAARLRPGFQLADGEKVIRPEIVSVFAARK